MNSGDIIKVGIFSDKGMGSWFVQSFEYLPQGIEIVLFISEGNKHCYHDWRFRINILSNKEERLPAIKNPTKAARLYLLGKIRKKGHFYPRSIEKYLLSKPFDIAITKSPRSLYTLSYLKSKFNFGLIYRYPHVIPYVDLFDEWQWYVRKFSYGINYGIKESFIRDYDSNRKMAIVNSLTPNNPIRKKILANDNIEKLTIYGKKEFLEPDGSVPSARSWVRIRDHKDTIKDNSDFIDALSGYYARIVAEGGCLETLRHWETLAAGCLLISTRLTHKTENFLEAGKHYIEIDDDSNLTELQEDIRKNKNRYEKIRVAGYEFAINNCQTIHRARYFLNKIEGHL